MSERVQGYANGGNEPTLPEDVDVEMVRAGLVWQPEVVSGPKLAALARLESLASRLRTAEGDLANVKWLMNARLEREDALHAENARLREALADCLRHLDFEAGDDDQWATGARNRARALLAEPERSE